MSYFMVILFEIILFIFGFYIIEGGFFFFLEVESFICNGFDQELKCKIFNLKLI